MLEIEQYYDIDELADVEIWKRRLTADIWSLMGLGPTV